MGLCAYQVNLCASLHSGECKDTEMNKKLLLASEQKLLPNLMAIRESLCDAIRSERPEIEVMGSTAMQHYDAALAFRRKVLDETLQVCSRKPSNGNMSFYWQLHSRC